MRIYSRYLVCYDVEDNKTRRKLYESLKDLGLVPVQKSVFLGDLNQAEIRSLDRLVRKLLDSGADRCFWIKSDLEENDLRLYLGYENFVLQRPEDSHCV